MKLSAILFTLLLTLPVSAQEQTDYLLNTVKEVDAWPCKFYELNRNSDISVANTAKWMALEEDESDWQTGVGPFSTDQNMFFVTDWASEVHPLLVRRHFNLSTEDIEHINDGDVYVTFSYDENPVIYLNGTQIAQASGWNDNNYATNKLPNRRRTLFKEGDNVLAVSVMQGAGGGHIDYGLYVTYTKTGIDNLQNEIFTAGEMHYNIAGQQLSSDSQKSGLVVVKGKKMITK